MLDDRVRAGEHQRGVTGVEPHQVGRLPAGSPDLDDLARPPRMAHNVGVYVEPIPDGCLHAATSSPAFAHGMSAFPTLAEPEDTLTMYPDRHGPVSTSTLLAGTGRAWRLPSVLAQFRISQLDERNSAPNKTAADQLLVP
jgi:hypothetical protein